MQRMIPASSTRYQGRPSTRASSCGSVSAKVAAAPLKLTRFHGHRTVTGEGVPSGQNATTVCVRIPTCLARPQRAEGRVAHP